MMPFMPPIARLTALAHDPEPDFAAVIESIKRACGTNTQDLAIALQLKPRQLNKIELGLCAPSWAEGDLLLRALEVCGRS
jgi:ribosome-binding protein aMBF1 (putative translation factor)